MLTLYRRHLSACPPTAKGRSWRRCTCPVWVSGTLGGVKVKRSLDLRSWAAATEKIREWEAARKILDDSCTAAEDISVGRCRHPLPGGRPRLVIPPKARSRSTASCSSTLRLRTRTGSAKASPSLKAFAAGKGIVSLDGLSAHRHGWCSTRVVEA